MVNTENVIDANIRTYTFSNESGEVLASFRLNPADIRIPGRVFEAAEHFRKMAQEIPERVTDQDFLQLNNEWEERICYVLGYDARQSLFGFLSATTKLSSGESFGSVVMKRIAEAVAEEYRKRLEILKAAVHKHTAKYE